MSRSTSAGQGSAWSWGPKYTCINIAIDIGPRITQATWIYTTKDAGPRLRGLHAWPRYNAPSAETAEAKLRDPRLRKRQNPKSPPFFETPSVMTYFTLHGDRVMDVPVDCLFQNVGLSDLDAQRLHVTRVKVMTDFIKHVQYTMKHDTIPTHSLPKYYKAVYNISCGRRDIDEDFRKVFDDVATQMHIKLEHLRVTCAARDIVYADIDEEVNAFEDGEIHLAVHHLLDRIEFTTFKLKRIDQEQSTAHLEITDVSFECMSFQDLHRESWAYSLGAKIARPGTEYSNLESSFGCMYGLDWIYSRASRVKTDIIFDGNISGDNVVVTAAMIRTVHDRVLFHISSQIIANIQKLKAFGAKIHLRSGIYTPMMRNALQIHNSTLNCLPMRKAWFARGPLLMRLSSDYPVTTNRLLRVMDDMFPLIVRPPVQECTLLPEEDLTEMGLSETDSDRPIAQD